MEEPLKFKLQVNLNKERVLNLMMNVDIVANLGTGRTWH